MKVGNLIAAGLRLDGDADTLYIRNQSKLMMKILDKMTVKPIQFQGCPGVGKSTTIFGYLNIPAVASKGYLWIHFEGKQCYTVQCKSTEVILKTSTFSLNSIYEDYLYDLVRTISDVSFIVIDGVTINELNSELFYLAALRKSVKVVSCTSRGAKSFSTERSQKIRYPRKVTVESWKYEEYKEAFKKNLPALKARYKNLEELTKAYFYAGGSMRFMCTDIEEIIDTLESKFNEVSDYSLLLRGLRGDQSKGFVNTLMQIIDGNSVFLSKYVCRKLARKVDAAFIHSALDVNVGNPSWQGMVYEMKIIHYIQNSLDPLCLLSNSINNSSESWPTVFGGGANQMDFDPPVTVIRINLNATET